MTFSEESKRFKELESKHSKLILGETWCVVELEWYKGFKKYIEQDLTIDGSELKFPKPGPIKNTPLFSKKPKLKTDLMINANITLVHFEVWKFLELNYGGGPIIKKTVLSLGPKKEKKIIIHPLRLSLYAFSKTKYSKKANLSFGVQCKINQLWMIISKFLKTPQHKIKLFILEQDNVKGSEILRNNNETFYDSILEQDDKVVYEVATNHKSRSVVQEKPAEEIGLTGFRNLGNTCFMNSGLQCLLNTKVLCDYFLDEDKYLQDINKTNVIGTGGNLAKAFGNLVKEYWSGNHSIISPRELKFVIGKFASQFNNFAQQDSQELLSFLLDGLHEDLNKIYDKPYVPDIEGRNCKDLPKLAADSLVNYKKRNDSFIVDHLQGMVQNRLICPYCDGISYKFDPLMYLTVPIPSTRKLEVNITVIPYNQENKNKMVYHVQVQKSFGLEGILNRLTDLSEIQPDNLQLVELYNSRIYKEFVSLYSTDNIKSKDEIVAFEIPDYNKETEVIVPIYFYFLKVKTNLKCGFPVKICLPKGKINQKELIKIIQKKLKETMPNLEEKCENFQKEGDCELLSDDVKNKLSKSNQMKLQKDYGFIPLKFLPAYRITISESIAGKSKTKLINHETDLETDTMININKKTLIGIRINPNFLLKEPDFLIGLLNVEKHQSAILYQQEEFEKLKKKKKITVPLSSCLKAFVEEERLSRQNKWYCPTCEKHVQAFKKFDIWELPEILIIHLKRFSPIQFFRNKVTTLIDFPKILDMKPYVVDKSNSKDYHYKLYAVSNHFGGIGGGHYTAYAINKTTNKWYQYDDYSVTPIEDPDSVITPAAYVLFYEKIKKEDIQQQTQNIQEKQDNKTVDEESNEKKTGQEENKENENDGNNEDDIPIEDIDL
ncbi:ubiquitin carboxyl-terminal hydrolase [Anaeramoeba flamelloides]|uniref:Ubiquitin carboxyl-terminal hydrolase n=1 Tax=Anaeramoeba flamelloides TaxID=1746091 RepID=A0ABQ8YRD8_9EUKA|nr:ubiquitin carboxyl-terminal hydrolase [Anaeramoeba flamelloides]